MNDDDVERLASGETDLRQRLVELAESCGVGVEPLDELAGRRLLDEAAQFYLGISGEKFVEEWTEGKFDPTDRSEVLAVAMMLPAVGISAPLAGQ